MRYSLALAILLATSAVRAEEAAAPLAVPPPAPAPPPRPEEPPTGIPWIVVGSLSTAAGVLNLAGAPLCLATLQQAQRTPCAATSIAFGGAFLAAGIPLLVVGAGKSAAWHAWLGRVVVAPSPTGAALGYRGAF